MSAEGSNANVEVFVYTGEGDTAVPRDVVRILVDPSVRSIPARAFQGRKKLAEVELCEGLVEIGEYSFSWCGRSITKIIIPSSLRRIYDYAFAGSLRTSIRLHDDIQSIGEHAFASCIFTNFRVPPLITAIPGSMLTGCNSLFSLEIPHNVTEIEDGAFYNCYCLRNVAFPPDAVFGNNIFIGTGRQIIDTDLLQHRFDSIAQIINELRHRFNGLPIHRMVYYQSYNQGVLQILIAAINMRSGQSRSLNSKLDPTGNQQDCLGMTPLHILACSSVHNLELYRVIVDKYPANLITEDRWGALPLLYAFWGSAPSEIIQFLLNSYQSLYPGHAFNWTMIVETMGRCDTPKESIENLLCAKQMHFPSQNIDWEYLLDKFLNDSPHLTFQQSFAERMQFLYMCGMSYRVEALAFTVWRDHIKNMIKSAKFNYYNQSGNQNIVRTIQAKITHFEAEYYKLKEAMTYLSLHCGN